MPFEQLQAHATRMMFHWARNRGPWALAKMAYVNWRLSGTRRSLSFVFSWIRSWFPRGADPAPTG
jgi:hypothetical protein